MVNAKQRISLERAEEVGDAFCDKIRPWCERQMVVGSVRRQKAWVHDIDIVVIPRIGGVVEIAQWVKNQTDGTRLLKMGRTGLQILFQQAQVDLYFATPDTWWTLVLIRTGSAQHNINLCVEARNQKLSLHADGRGLYNRWGQKIALDSEEEFFERLGLEYKRPEARD